MTPAFSPTDAAFAGFRLMRERPRALMAWTALQTGFIVVWFVVNGVFLASSAERFRALAQINQADPGAALAQASAMAPTLLPLLLIDALVFLFFSGVQTAAIFRAYLRPQESRRGYLRLGRTELSVALVPVIYSLLWLAYLFVVLFVVEIAGGLGGALTGTANALFRLVLFVVLATALVYPAVRLSLAIPLTFASGKIHIFHSWTLTRGRFWPLFGAYVLTFAYVFVVGLVALILFAALSWMISRALGGTGFDAWRAGEAPIAAQALTALISLPFDGLLLAATFAIWRGPSAEAYQMLSGARGAAPGA